MSTINRNDEQAAHVESAVARILSLHDAVEREYGQLGPMQDYPQKGIESFRNVALVVLRHVPLGAPIIDFGAGRCLKAAVCAELGYSVTAVDDFGDAWHREDRSRAERVAVFAKLSGVRLVDAVPEGAQYAMIMLHDVLEHLPNSPRHLLEPLLAHLAPRGSLFVTVPNAANLRKRVALVMGKTNLPPYAGFYWHEGEVWRGHIREYVRDDLVQLARFLELRVIELRSCHHMTYKVPPLVRPVYRAVASIFPGWRDTWLLVGQR